jgi:3-dehydroquinate synthase
MRSGIGEILKVHAIDSAKSFDLLANHYDDLTSNRSLLSEYIGRSLLIKKKYIEVDEFDKDIRNIFNYGHSFGHAIESATKYLIPHGVAVSMGMDMANRIAVLRNLISVDRYHRMHKVLRKNYEAFSKTPMALDEIISALTKDKKNTTTQLSLIFPVGEKANIEKVNLTLDDSFRSQCQVFLDEMKLMSDQVSCQERAVDHRCECVHCSLPATVSAKHDDRQSQSNRPSNSFK